MGLTRGSLTFTRFFVSGSPPRDFRNRFVQAARLRRFEPLAAEDEAQEASGWCALERPFDLELDHEKIYHDHYLLLGFRVDRWRIPGAALRAHLADEERRVLEKTGRAKLSRAQKAELKQRVVARLRRKVLPSTLAIDVCWDLDAGTVLFFSHSPRLALDFAALFEKTFGLGLHEDSPYFAAGRAPLSTTEQRALARVQPVSFSSGRKRLGGRQRSQGAERPKPSEPQPPTENVEPSGDLVDRIETTRFLGSELLLWLWMKHELLDAELEIPEIGPCEAWLGTELTLASPLDPGERVALRGAAPTSGAEAKAALAAQKFPVRARLGLRSGEDEFDLVLKADTLQIGSASIPARIQDGDDAFLERMALVERLTAMLDGIYATFLRVRLDPRWSSAWEPALVAWLEDAPPTGTALAELSGSLRIGRRRAR